MKCDYEKAMLDSWHSFLKGTSHPNCASGRMTYREWQRLFNMTHTEFRYFTYARQDREAAERREINE